MLALSLRILSTTILLSRITDGHGPSEVVNRLVARWTDKKFDGLLDLHPAIEKPVLDREPCKCIKPV